MLQVEIVTEEKIVNNKENNGNSLYLNNLFKSLLFSIICFLTFLLFLEFMVFRFILPASEWPYRISTNNAEEPLRFFYKNKPMYKSGVLRKGFPEDIRARYKINSDGWNSNKEYIKDRVPSVKRIAVIGDSFVEALQVDADKSFSEVIEQTFYKKGFKNVEVYRFGASAAPLSQYLLMLKYVMKKYRPDIVIINIIDNDFYGSLEQNDTYGGVSLHFKRKNNTWVEVKPKPYINNPILMILKQSRIFRYFYINLGLNTSIKNLEFNTRAIFKQPNSQKVLDKENNNLEVIEDLVRFIFQEYKRTAGQNSRILLMITDRKYMYSKQAARTSLYAIAYKEAVALSIPFIDLTKIFSHDYAINKNRFEFKTDGHWNEMAHGLVGKYITNYLIDNKWITY